MQSEQIFIFFILLLVLEQAAEAALVILNLRFASANAANLPNELTHLYDQDTHSKSLKYTRHKAYFALFSEFCSLSVLMFLLFSDVLAKYDFFLRGYEFGTVLHGTVYLVSLIVFSSIISLPLSYYSSFILEEKFGFNKTTLRQWIKDQLLGLVLSLVISGGVVSLLLFLMDQMGEVWWIYASVSLIVLQLFLAFIFPIWIAPLFNKFSDLADQNLKEQIVKMVEKVGYKTTGVYSVDGSKRSKHANAYFAGIGKSKRIVLYDTLISLLSTEQLLAVLAHEIGHEKLGHIKKSILFSSLMVFTGFYLLNYFYSSPEFYQAFGFTGPSNHAALLVFSLLSGPLMYFISPLFNMLSRKFEYQADSFAVQATGSYKPLAESLAALSKNSLSNLNPHPWYSFMHYSHPALAERITAMSKL